MAVRLTFNSRLDARRRRRRRIKLYLGFSWDSIRLGSAKPVVIYEKYIRDSGVRGPSGDIERDARSSGLMDTLAGSKIAGLAAVHCRGMRDDMRVGVFHEFVAESKAIVAMFCASGHRREPISDRSTCTLLIRENLCGERERERHGLFAKIIIISEKFMLTEQRSSRRYVRCIYIGDNAFTTCINQSTSRH